MKDMILLGDTHFGHKNFDIKVFEEQIALFHEQIFPYMEENDITHIIQVGDLMDNRRLIDINLLSKIVDLFQTIEDKGFTMTSILGNHDIYYKNTLDINLVQYFQRMFPNTFKLYDKRTKVDMNGTNVYFIPWICDIENNPITLKELEDVDVIFGHLEIKNFELVKGHKDNHSKLSANFFNKSHSKATYSGHYHIKSSKGDIHYLGTPYQQNWGDYDTPRGFYRWNPKDPKKTEFILNETSPKFVKIMYDDTVENRITISGLGQIKRYKSAVEIDIDLNNNILKFFINKSETHEYVQDIFELKRIGLEFVTINNVEIGEMVGIDYGVLYEEDKEKKEERTVDNISTYELIINTVGEKQPEYLNCINSIMTEIRGSE